jgi:aminoglycoside phosphotransferase (APT) family kinase protein
LLTGGGRSINKVVGLVFAEAERQPQLAVKIARVPESVPALAREATTLQAIQLLRPNGIPGVPRRLFCRDLDGLLAVGETVLSGVPLWTILQSENYTELALRATDWLAELAGHPPRAPQADWWNRLIQPVIDDFQHAFGSILDQGMLRTTVDILRTLGPVPLVCEQRDFSPWNVLLAGDRSLVVLDWESAELQGLPAMDLIYFLTYLAFFHMGAMKSGRFREAYRATLDLATPLGRVRQECLDRYADRIGIDIGQLRALRLLVWLLHSRSEYQHLVADAAGKPAREVLRRSLFVSLWEEEMRYEESYD